MICINPFYRLRLKIFIGIMMGFFIFTGALPAYSHGGISHDGEMFTALQAVQKATQLYDRLISSGKLAEAWETGLRSISLHIRKLSDKREYVVRFQRTGGDPDSVYFFFDQAGEYSGSNFTGK